MKIKNWFFIFSFLFILIPAVPIFAGNLYNSSLQGIAREQGWLAEHIGGTCKYREPSNAEIQKLEKYCKGYEGTICFSAVENLIEFKNCSTYGKVIGIKDNNVVFEQNNINNDGIDIMKDNEKILIEKENLVNMAISGLFKFILNNKNKISSLFSLIVAIAILSANYSQWWHITYDGKMITKKWVKILFGISILFLIIAGILILL